MASNAQKPTPQSPQGALYVVATPIGNLADLSPRARDVLTSADVVLAEDTRHSAQLLRSCGIDRSMVSLHEHNEAARVPEILGRLQKGASVALISDAGTPLISDPGYRLVRAATEAGVDVRAVPGACAAIAALSISGLATDRFCFEGFLPAKSGSRKDALNDAQQNARTLIYYEAPHRLAASLEDMAAVFGPSRRAVVARELTKTFESAYRGTLGELAARAREDGDMTRGEAVILVEGAPPAADESSAELDRALRILRSQLPLRQAAELAAALTGTASNAAYRRALALEKESQG